MAAVGLRVDVDTLRGTRIGVPRLLEILAGHRIRASFFFSVGPDNMGRHLWRLLRPAFLIKMLRTNGARLYGWDILLRGTLWPGPVIGNRCREQIRAAAAAGHEMGLHAWDHHSWQRRLARLDTQAVAAQVGRGHRLLSEVLQRPPDCFAAPAWQVTPDALLALDRFDFRYESDCRGHSVFRPVVAGRPLAHAQVPTTLPTYDELIGRQCTARTYNSFLLDLIRPGRLNVLTIHAEVEGIGCLDLFRDFLDTAGQRHIEFRPLGDMLFPDGRIEEGTISTTEVPGREGWLSCQTEGREIPEKIPQCRI